MKIFTRLLVLMAQIVSVLGVVSVSAVDLVPYRVEIIAPTTAYVNEALDVTLKIVDKNGTVVPTFRGTIIFTSDDIKADLPYTTLGYQFRTEDRGEKTFSKGIIFKNTGDFYLTAGDLGDTIEGKVTIKVSTRGVTTTPTPTESVEIIAPENNSTQVGEAITVSGKAKKNSKVVIFLNGVEVGSTIVQSDGNFVKNLSGLSTEKNILTAKLYSGNNVVIGESTPVNFTLSNSLPLFYGVSTQPASPVSGSSFSIVVEAEAGLSEVSYTLDGVMIPLAESEGGKYTATGVAPATAGSYPIDLTLKNTLGQSLSKTAALTLEIGAPTAPVFRNVKASTEKIGSGSRVVFLFSLENAPTDLGKFRIRYGTGENNLSQEILTYEAAKIKKPDGSYQWYIPGLASQKWFFQITPLLMDGTAVSVQSDILDVSMPESGCVIGNVGGITVDTQKDKSILRWEALPEAKSYKIYKKDETGEMTFIETVTEPTYTVFLSPDTMAYADFGIRALCSDGQTESPDMALASQVKTGPALMLVLLLGSGFLAFFFARRRYLS